MNWVKIVNFVRAAHQKSAGAALKVQGGKRMTQGNSRGQTVVGAGGDKRCLHRKIAARRNHILYGRRHNSRTGDGQMMD